MEKAYDRDILAVNKNLFYIQVFTAMLQFIDETASCFVISDYDP